VIFIKLNMGKRTTEFVLGLLGGIFGFIGAFFAMAVAGIGGAFGAEGASTISSLGWLALLFSVLAIVGSVVVKHKPRLGGVLMLVSAIGGLISISFGFFLSFVLLLIAGLMGIFKKKD
jgi:hypothetical protein